MSEKKIDGNLKSMDLGNQEILEIASRAGRLVLENGGETYRAEETMNRAALSLGAVVSESFVTPTVVMLSVQDNDKKTETIIHRVKKREINLGKIGSINALSRKISSRTECPGRTKCPDRTECPGKAGFYTTGKQISYVLSRIENSPVYPVKLQVLFYGLVPLFFSLIFDGTLKDCLGAFVSGCCLRGVMFILSRFNFPSFISTLTEGFFVSFCIRFASCIHIVDNPEISSISVLMVLVPGLAIVNAIRDIIAGDLVAGLARGAEAFIVAAALSFGAGLGVLLFDFIGF